MNQKQREYALNRASVIAKNRITAAELEHKVAGRKLSKAEMEAALRLGNFEVLPRHEWGTSYSTGPKQLDIGDVLKFPDETKPSVLPGLDEKVAAIKAQEAKVKDLIMLGDAADAIKWLEAFGTGQPVTEEGEGSDA